MKVTDDTLTFGTWTGAFALAKKLQNICLQLLKKLSTWNLLI